MYHTILLNPVSANDYGGTKCNKLKAKAKKGEIRNAAHHPQGWEKAWNKILKHKFYNHNNSLKGTRGIGPKRRITKPPKGTKK